MIKSKDIAKPKGGVIMEEPNLAVLIPVLLIFSLGLIFGLSAVFGHFLTRKNFAMIQDIGQSLGLHPSRGFLLLIPSARGSIKEYRLSIRYTTAYRAMPALYYLDIVYPQALEQDFFVHYKISLAPPGPGHQEFNDLFSINTRSSSVSNRLAYGELRLPILALHQQYELDYFNITAKAIRLGIRADTISDRKQLLTAINDFIDLADKVRSEFSGF